MLESPSASVLPAVGEVLVSPAGASYSRPAPREGASPAQGLNDCRDERIQDDERGVGGKNKEDRARC